MSQNIPAHVKMRRKVQAYSFLSTFFLIVGTIVFLNLYVDNVQGNLLEALRKPATVGIFLLPFLPAFILSHLATRALAKYRAMLQKTEAPKSATSTTKKK